MTTIQSQLKQLSSKGTKVNQLIPSIFHSVENAGSQDIDQIYYNAIKGINLLIQVDGGFLQFKDTLLSTKHRGVSRVLLTQKENSQLDEQLKEIMLRLSSYFLYEPTLKVLEYLLRNFQIHSNLPIQTTLYFIQYHSTPVYTRLLQNLVDDHRGQSDMLRFLYTPISKGEVLKKELILRQFRADSRLLLNFIEFLYDKKTLKTQTTQEYTFDISGRDQLVLSQDVIVGVKRRRPNDLTFLFEILFSINEKPCDKLVDSIRPALGKLLGMLVEFPNEEGLSLVYFVLNLPFNGMKQHWLTDSQVDVLQKYIFSNISGLKEFKNIFQIIEVLFSLNSTPSNWETYIQIFKFYEDSKKIPSVGSLIQTLDFINQQKINIIDAQFLKFYLINLGTYISKETKNSQSIIESILQVLDQSNSFALSIIEMIKLNCTDIRIIKKYFQDDLSVKVTAQNIDSFKMKDLNNLTIHQLTQITYDIERLLAHDSSHQMVAIKLIDKILSICQSRSPLINILSLDRLNKIFLSCQSTQNNKFHQLINQIYAYVQHFFNDEDMKLQVLLRICYITHKTLTQTVNQLATQNPQDFEWISIILENQCESLLKLLQNSAIDNSMVYFILNIILELDEYFDSDVFFIICSRIIETESTSDQFLVMQLIQNLIQKQMSLNGRQVLEILLKIGKGCKAIVQHIKQQPKILIILMDLIYEHLYEQHKPIIINAFSIISHLQIVNEIENEINLVINSFLFFNQFILHTLNQTYQKIIQTLTMTLKQKSKSLDQITISFINSTFIIKKQQIKETLFSIYKDKSTINLTQQSLVKHFTQSDQRIQALVEQGLICVMAIKVKHSSEPYHKLIQLILNSIAHILLVSKQFTKGRAIFESLQKQISRDQSSITILHTPFYKFLALQKDQQPQQLAFEFTDEDLIGGPFLSLLNSTTQAHLIIIYGQSRIHKSFAPQTDFDIKFVLGHLQQLVKNSSFEEADFLTNLLVLNVKKLNENDIIELLKSPSDNKALIPLMLTIIQAFVKEFKELDSPIHDLIYSKICDYEKGNEKRDLSDPLQYQTYLQFFNLLTLMMQQKHKKQAYQLIVKYVEQQIRGQIESSQILILLEIIMKCLNRNTFKFIHQTRFTYFITIITFLAMREKDEDMSQVQKFLSAFRDEELWVILYICSKYQFENKDYLGITKGKDLKVSLFWMQAHSESLILNQVKDSRRRQIKGLPILVDLKSKIYKYQTNQLKKIVGKVESTVNFLRSNLKELVEIKQFSFKKQILQTFNHIQYISQNIDFNQITEYKSQKQFIHTLLSISRIEQFYLHSKLGALAQKRKTEILNKVNLLKLMEILVKFNENKSITKLILVSITQILLSHTAKIRQTELVTLVQFVDSCFMSMINNDILSVFYVDVLIAAFSNIQLKKQMTANKQQFNESSRFYHNIITLLSMQRLKDKKSQILSLLIDAGFLFRNLIIADINLIADQMVDLTATSNSQTIFKYETNTIKEKYAAIGIVSNLDCRFKYNSKIINEFLGQYCRFVSKQAITSILTILLVNDDTVSLKTCITSLETRVLMKIFPKLLTNTISLTTTRKLIQTLKSFYETFDEITVSENYVEVTQWTIKLLNYPQQKFINEEVDGTIFEVDQIENDTIDSFLSLVVKMNDNQLKKSFNLLVQWAKVLNNTPGYNYSQYNRLVFFKLVSRISSKLGSLFTKYYGYIFDSMINSFNDFHSTFSQAVKKNNLSKRTSNEPDMYYKLAVLQCRHTLQCFEQMCVNDSDEFFDTEKFEKIAQPLSFILDCPKMNEFENISDFINDWVSPTIQIAFQQINDEFKWKSLNYYILQVMQKHSKKDSKESLLICVAILKMIDKLADSLGDRFSVLVNDLVPYLYNLGNLNLESDEMDGLLSQLITKLSNICGEDIQSMMKTKTTKKR